MFDKFYLVNVSAVTAGGYSLTITYSDPGN